MFMTTPTEDLRNKILNDILIHEENCDSSIIDGPCNCVQKNVAANILQAISQQPTEHSLEDELPTIPPKKVEEIRNLEWYLERLPESIWVEVSGEGKQVALLSIDMQGNGEAIAVYKLPYDKEFRGSYSTRSDTPLQAAQSLYKKLIEEGVIEG